MSNTNSALPRWRFSSLEQSEIETLPGKIHHWLLKPGMVEDTNLIFIRAHLLPGESHKFHCHPGMEEILYFLSGKAEQWVEREPHLVGPGDSLFIAPGVVHGTYNVGTETLDFLAVLSPAKYQGPMTVELSDQEPWRSLSPGISQRGEPQIRSHAGKSPG